MDKTEVIQQFNIMGDVVAVKPLGNGHINDTSLVITTQNKYTLQRINTGIFSNVEALMDNVFAVTEYLAKHYPNERTLNFIPTKSGEKYYRDGEDCYRAWVFIDNVVALDAARNLNDFYQSAVAFGDFAKKLADFPAHTLHEIIKDFHNTKWRIGNLKAAAKADKCGRLSGVMTEYEGFISRESMIETGVTLPLRVTHNDTKLNNVLLDEITGKPVCVIDLDTVMPGLVINDFGDSIRFGASTAAEDEKNITKVHFSLELFEAYVKGYFEGVGDALTEDEINLLPYGAMMMTYECGSRFLTDYLEGDTYFKTAYPEHNLVRARTQLRLLEEMEANYKAMCDIIAKYRPKF